MGWQEGVPDGSPEGVTSESRFGSPSQRRPPAGHVALDVDSGAGSAGGGGGSSDSIREASVFPPISLVIHGIEGALCTSMGSPYVRVHAVDTVSGHWKGKATLGAGRPAVLSVDANGKPLGAAPQDPWQAHKGQSSYIRPFSTKPHKSRMLRGGTQRAPPRWEESFLVAEPLPQDTTLLFEILDVVEDRPLVGGQDDDDEDEQVRQVVRLGWAFVRLDRAIASAQANKGAGKQRRLRLQLYRYRSLRGANAWSSKGWFDGAAAAEAEESAGRPDVFTEFHGGGGFEDGGWQGFLATAFSTLTGRGRAGRHARQPCSATLEVSAFPMDSAAVDLSSVPVSPDVDMSAVNQSILSGTSAVPSTIAPVNEDETAAVDAGDASALADAAAAAAAVEETVKLAPHHTRHKDEPCAIPEGLLWQISAGKRGAFRMSMSPSGQLLAVAAARHGGTCELRVYNVVTGRLHAACSVPHDALVYDLCWHTFGGAGDNNPAVGETCPPLLISCGGDCVVQVYEVPETINTTASGAALLRPHARLQLPGHVYSVRPHPALSADPRRVVLVCAGHGFGLMVCDIVRQQVAASGHGSRWRAQTPHAMQHVQYDYRSAQAALGLQRPPMFELGATSRSTLSTSGMKAHRREPSEQSRERDQPPDVLCIRFSGQATSPDNLYATDAEGHVMLFQVRFDPVMEGGRGGVRGSLVRAYSAPSLAGAQVYSLEVVTQQLLNGRRLSQLQVSTVDDWVLLFARDHIVRLASLQRGVLRVELEMSGLECGNYPVRGMMSPDGAYVACGSESGELLVWNAGDGKLLPQGVVPQVKLAGPVMDAVWSHHHHMVACCALADQSPPLLIFVGGDPERPPSSSLPEQPSAVEMLAKPVPFRDVPRDDRQQQQQMKQQQQQQQQRQQMQQQERQLPPVRPPPALLSSSMGSVATSAGPGSDWAAQWVNADSNPRSAIALDEKRQMKAMILAQLREKKGALDLERSFASARSLPGGV